MPRAKSYRLEAIVRAAMEQFWWHGFAATSIDDLVRSTGVSRHGLYGEFSGKDTLFQACLDAYSDDIVTPAFLRVETAGATLAEVGAYFEQQIALAEEFGLPGPGCLMANTMTEVAPHNAPVMARVAAHNRRLHAGFENALRGTARADGERLSAAGRRERAAMMVVFTNGLWSVSRTADNGAALRRSASRFLKLLVGKET